MRFKCIACGKEWGPLDASDGYSHGYCKECVREQMKPLVRKKQMRKHGISCFCSNMMRCPRTPGCKYTDICTTEGAKR